MNRILFQINYDVYPEKRDAYISTMKELENYLKNNRNHNYIVVEDKTRRNNFTEIYICNDEAEFEKLEDEMDDTIYDLTTKILKDYVVNGKTKYSTFYELN
jgi:hypothetical protein